MCFHTCAGTCPAVLSTVCLLFVTLAAEGDKPNEQRPSNPQAGRTQSLYRRLLQRPTQRLYLGRRQELRRLREQAAPEWPGVHLLCACCSGNVWKCKCFLISQRGSPSVMSLLPSGTSIASDLMFFVLQTAHVNRQKGGKSTVFLQRLSPYEAWT